MKYEIKYLENDFPIEESADENWQLAENLTINKYWSGTDAPPGRHFETRILWSETAVYVRFEATQREPLIVSEKANLKTKTHGLWERDVCEIFLAPNKDEFRRYFEFEIAPNGEWIDLEIYQMPDKRETDWDYSSGMQSKSVIKKDRILMAIKIEWKAFGKIPKSGEVWRGNLFRCVGAGKTRGYLAWSPTFTDEPGFHVPERFGEFEFVK
ncbi:MAG: carbohydrate-binding family 9-like protein [Pyrinomonadaceae bacterium]|nr:carbohydrate-binding family 9-like protein [Pyrinomonadaceae bacterium]